MPPANQKQTAGESATLAKTSLLRRLLNFAKARQRAVVVLGSLGLVVVLIGGSWLIYRSTRSCESYIPQGQGALEASQNANIKKAVDSMMTTRNHDNDPNCLVVITSYYINLGDYDKAKASLDKLEKVYNPQIGYSQRLKGTNAKSIAVLRQDVAFLKLFNDQIQKNGRRLLSK